MTHPPESVSNPLTPRASPHEFREFPRHVYDADGAYVVVASLPEQEEKLAAGYFLTPGEAKASKKRVR